VLKKTGKKEKTKPTPLQEFLLLSPAGENLKANLKINSKSACSISPHLV